MGMVRRRRPISIGSNFDFWVSCGIGVWHWLSRAAFPSDPVVDPVANLTANVTGPILDTVAHPIANPVANLFADPSPTRRQPYSQPNLCPRGRRVRSFGLAVMSAFPRRTPPHPSSSSGV